MSRIVCVDVFQPHFIKQYEIPTDELLIKDLNGYKNFNQFFYRKLVPGARPAEQPDNSARIVSPADSRSVMFPIDEVTTYWIKVAPSRKLSPFPRFWRILENVFVDFRGRRATNSQQGG